MPNWKENLMDIWHVLFAIILLLSMALAEMLVVLGIIAVLEAM